MTVKLTALAKQDIAGAQGWNDQQSPGLGFKFLDRVNETIRRIEERPLQFQAVVQDVRRARIQRFPYGIFFKTKGDNSVVIACLHHRREPALLISRVPRS